MTHIESTRLAREILQLRGWQHLVNEALKENRFPVPVHVAMGHEALAVALHHAMRAADQLALSHRNIAYNLARAGALEPLWREYQALPAGMAGGKLGSMNLSQPARGVIYVSSILGNNLPVACGLALAHRVRNSGGAVWVLTGDGAIEEGAFYESLIFAKSHALPVIFLIENNDHSLASRIAERRCTIHLAQICSSVDVPYQALAGNDASGYLHLLGQVRENVPAGPQCVEAYLSTLTNHAGPTPGWASDPKEIHIGNGLVVENSPRDPAHLASHSLPPEELAAIGAQLLALARSLGIAHELLPRCSVP